MKGPKDPLSTKQTGAELSTHSLAVCKVLRGDDIGAVQFQTNSTDTSIRMPARLINFF